MKTIIAAIVITIAAAVLGLAVLGALCFRAAGDIMKCIEEWDGGINEKL